MHDAADRQAEEFVDLAHPAGVALGQVVVDRHHVHALAFERVEIDRERRHQGLALAGLHFGDLAAVQNHSAQQLHVEMPLAERTLRRLAHGRESLDQHGVQRLALLQALPELLGAGTERLVGQVDQLRLKRVDGVDLRLHLLDQPLVRGAEYRPEKCVWRLQQSAEHEDLDLGAALESTGFPRIRQ